MICVRTTTYFRDGVFIIIISVLYLLNILEFVDYVGVPTSIKLPSKS